MLVMKWLIVFAALLVSPAAWSAVPVILVMGDSLSAGYGIDARAGWVNLLGQRLQQQGYPHRVINASISGETSAGGRTRLPPALQRHHPAIVVIELGANDGLRGLSLRDTRANLAAMIESAKRAGAQVLLVGIHLPPNYGPEFTHKFRAVYDDLVQKFRIPYAPFLLEGVALTPGLMQADGLHPRAAAQPRMLDNVWPYLAPLLKPAPVAQQHSPAAVP